MLNRLIILISVLPSVIGNLSAQDEKKYMSMLVAKIVGFRLPNDTIPRLYTLELDAHLDEEPFTFTGLGSIVFEVLRPTRDVTLHVSSLLEIDKTHTRLVLNDGTSWKPIAQRWNSVLEFFNIRFAEKLPLGKHTIKLKWLGHEAQDFRGFYRTGDSAESDISEYVAATHFQPTAARRAFPCWDEPGLKAEFEISLKHNPNRTALSNMPIRSVVEAGDDMHLTHFDKSPPMSTYLVSFFVADYDKLENKYGNLTFWTKRDGVDDVKHAHEVSQLSLAAMESYTGIPYALSKMDQVSVPEYSSFATEHWGIISYGEFAITYNPSDNGLRQRDTVALLTMHETIHQWFGNLVTPAWWDDLWLSEAFAVYLSYRIGDMIFDQWHGMNRFLAEMVNPVSFHADEWSQNKRPIHWKPESPAEIREMFSSVTYRKGAAVLHMLEEIVSEEVFTDGLRRYLNKHQYGVATTDDLWQALQESYLEKGKHPHLQIKEMMDPWIDQTGYPMLNISRNYKTGLTNVTQCDAMDPTSGNTWMIPITFTTETQPDFGYRRPTHWMRRSSENLTLYGIDISDWVILNIQQTGFYRVNYDDENWKRIAEYLNTVDYYKIHVKNRAQLIWDLYHYSKTEDKYLETLIDVTMYLYQEIHYLPWIPAIRFLREINDNLINTPSYDIFEKVALYLINNITNHIGYHSQPNEDQSLPYARQLILPWACAFGHEGCRHAAGDFLAVHLQNPDDNPIPADEQDWVYCNGLMGANQTVWEEVMSAYLANPRVQPGFQYLGCTDNRYLMRKYLSLATAENSSHLTDQVTEAFTSIISGRRENVDFALDYLTHHIDRIRLHFNARNLPDQVDFITEKFSQRIKNPDQYEKFRRFLVSQEDTGTIKDATGLLEVARHSMEAAQKLSTLFHTLADKKPTLFDIMHGTAYIKNI